MGEVLLQTPSVGSVYPIRDESGHIPTHIAIRESGDLWHQCLGHCGDSLFSSLRRFNLIPLNTKFENNCKTCCLAKSHRLPFELVEHSAVSPLELIYSNF